MNKLFFSALLLFSFSAHAQIKWTNVDSLFGPLPASVHVFKTTDSMYDGKPNIAYYVEADLKDKELAFLTDTTSKRRQTPSQFYAKNNQPLIVVNTTFFSFETNKSLNLVVKDGEIVAHNTHTFAGKGKDTLTYKHPLASAIGISKKRKADIAWLYADSTSHWPLAFEKDPQLLRDSSSTVASSQFGKAGKKWKMQAAVGGGPVLLQDGNIRITNNEEMRFAGKQINDKHPRTAIGYTKDNKLIILVVEGRHPGIAEGATLTHEAQLFKDLHCTEALNLDGGGSSCLLVNGKETIRISDPKQRPVPAVFIIKSIVR